MQIIDPVRGKLADAQVIAVARIRALLIGALAFLFVTEAGAHSWQEDATALGPDEVASVIAELQVLASAASDAGWSADSTSDDTLNAAVYAFAVTSGRLDALSGTTERVLVTFEALEKGVITADGTFAESPDALTWYQYLHPADAPAIAANRDALRALRTIFVGETN